MYRTLINKIREAKKKTKEKARIKLKTFKPKSDTDFKQKFIELCFCILVANAPIRKTRQIWEGINKGFIYLSKNALRKKLKKLGYRFYNVRANYIIDARKFINEINSNLKNKNEEEVREWLVENIKGIGWKEASHFLRNMGFQNFAILDRHVLRILNNYGVLNRIPSLSKKNYLNIERKLKKIAKYLNITLAELDLYLFYIDAKRIYEK